MAAADVTGIWSLELDPDFSGNQDTVGCGFRQDGNKLAIKCEDAEFAGEVNDQRVTWQFMTGPNKKVRATFSGLLDDGATTISGTWHLAGDPPQNGKFRAKKEK